MKCSPVKKVQRRFGLTYCHVLHGRISLAKKQAAGTERLLFICLAYHTILKIEALNFSETSVDFYRTKWRHLPEESLSYCSSFIFFHILPLCHFLLMFFYFAFISLLPTLLSRNGWRSGNALDFHSRVDRFASRPGHRRT
jgi:hypothetical protein